MPTKDTDLMPVSIPLVLPLVLSGARSAHTNMASLKSPRSGLTWVRAPLRSRIILRAPLRDPK